VQAQRWEAWVLRPLRSLCGACAELRDRVPWSGIDGVAFGIGYVLTATPACPSSRLSVLCLLVNRCGVPTPIGELAIDLPDGEGDAFYTEA
jgi:hypothetical protein